MVISPIELKPNFRTIKRYTDIYMWTRSRTAHHKPPEPLPCWPTVDSRPIPSSLPHQVDSIDIGKTTRLLTNSPHDLNSQTSILAERDPCW